MWPFKKRSASSSDPTTSAAKPAVASANAARSSAYCYVEFESIGEMPLKRLMAFFDLVKEAKDEDAPGDEDQLSAYLTDGERSYFSNLNPEESAEWNEYWFSTPLPRRHSPEMLVPQWDFASMLDAFWNGDYDLIAIRPQASRYLLEFNPHGYPYGSTGSLVAMVECFGHRVLGVDDGTGYERYVPRTNIWKPRVRQGER